jgi:hypothetical protein
VVAAVIVAIDKSEEVIPEGVDAVGDKLLDRGNEFDAGIVGPLPVDSGIRVGAGRAASDIGAFAVRFSERAPVLADSVRDKPLPIPPPPLPITYRLSPLPIDGLAMCNIPPDPIPAVAAMGIAGLNLNESGLTDSSSFFGRNLLSARMPEESSILRSIRSGARAEIVLCSFRKKGDGGRSLLISLVFVLHV